MNELVPEKRADKNGVVITRWVKPGRDSAAGSRHLPLPPAIPSTLPADNETLNEYAEFFAYYNCADTTYARELHRLVEKMTKPTAERLLNHMYDGGNFGNIWDINGIVRGIYGDQSTVDPQYRDVVLNNFISMVPDYGMLPDSDEEYVLDFSNNLFKDVGGMASTALFSEAQQRAYASVVAIATDIFKSPKMFSEEEISTATSRGFDVKNSRIALSDMRGVNLLVDHPDKIDLMREQLLSRKTFVYEVIREMLPAGAVGNGVL